MQNTTETGTNDRGLEGARRRAGEALVHAKDVLGTWSSALKGAVDVDLTGMVKTLPELAEAQLDALLARVGLTRIARVEAERAPSPVMDVSDEIKPVEAATAPLAEPVTVSDARVEALETAAETTAGETAETSSETSGRASSKNGKRRR